MQLAWHMLHKCQFLSLIKLFKGSLKRIQLDMFDRITLGLGMLR